MTNRTNCSRGGSFERTLASTSASLSSNMSSGSAGRNFMSSMSLIFNIEYQYEQLQVMKEKLQSRHGAVYATFLAEKLKKAFGLRALPSLAESQPIITFEGDGDDDLSFTIVYFNSLETSPLNYILKHYYGTPFMNQMNEVYSLLYSNTLNTSTVSSEISECEDGFDKEIEDEMDDEEQEIEEEKDDDSCAATNRIPCENDEDNETSQLSPLELDEDLSTLQQESINGQSSSGNPIGVTQKNIRNNSISERQATLATTAIVTNPRIDDNPRNGQSSGNNDCSSGEKSGSNYSIKYCDTKKLILNKSDGQSSSSTLLNDFNSLPGQGLREHLLFEQQQQQDYATKGIYSPNPLALKVCTTKNREVEIAKNPLADRSPQSLIIDDKSDPEWSPKRKPLSSRRPEQLRTALMAFKTPTPSDPHSIKRYMCNFKNCGKTFSVRSHLDTHKVTHTGEKRYICNECGGRFTQSSSLRNHRIAIHTKEFPHICSTCKKGFLLPSQLKKHKSNYHGSKKHLRDSNSTSNHANALAAKILAAAKTTLVQPVPMLWSSLKD